MTTTAQVLPLESPKSSVWAVSLLVSGTCIGGGMLALPVQTAEAGFALSFIATLICWGFMTYTGLLLIEATNWVKNETHFSSLSRIFLGKEVRLISILVYLFMNYASLVAYTAGGSALFSSWSQSIFGVALSYEMGCAVFTLMFGSLIYMGAFFIGRLNSLLMLGLVLTYFCLVKFGVSSINTELLAFRPAWKAGAGVFSMILACFSHQMIIPTLCLQMNYDTKNLKKALIVGTTIPFVIYSVWLAVVHGIVPLEGENGLRESFIRGASATESLRFYFNHWALSTLADFFAFFAIVTSYLGLSLALFGFLKDCFSEMKFNVGRSTIIMASIIPTLILAMMFPRALLAFLDLSGAYGDTILSGLIPIGMVWVGRYKMGIKEAGQIPGGRIALGVAALFYITVILFQWI